MKKTHLLYRYIFVFFTLLASCSTKKEWTTKANFIDFDNSRVTQIHLDEQSKDVIITNPKGVAKYNENGENLWIHESEGAPLKSILSNVRNNRQARGIKIGSMETEMPNTVYLRKVFYLPLKSGDFVEFNFDRLKQSLALIDGKSGKLKWELKEQSIWNIEDFRIVSDEAFDLMDKLSSEKNPIIPISEFVNKITENKIVEITETNRLILDARNGLISLNLENGEIDWKMAEHKGDLQALLYDKKSNSIIATYGSDMGASILRLGSQLGVNTGPNLSIQFD